MSGRAAEPPPSSVAWDRIPDRVRARGLRWTPQRATLVSVLAQAEGHVTVSQLIERCRELEPDTTPSTVYRTLDVLETLGVISHSHGRDGRQILHIRPATAHGHLICSACGSEEDLPSAEASMFLQALQRDRDFVASLNHLSVTGLCRVCRSSVVPV